MSRRREIDRLDIRMAVASVGSAHSPLSDPSLEDPLGQAEENRVPQAERTNVVNMWDVWGSVVAG